MAKAAADPGVRAVCEPIVFAPPRRARTFPGEVSAAAGRAAYDTIVRAVDAATARRRRRDRHRAGQQARLRAGRARRGRATPICSRICAARERVAMMFHSPQLKVVLITVHVPLQRGAGADHAGAGRSDDRSHREALPQFGMPRPRLAIAGLNPHAGEGGVLGDEDDRVLAPAVAARARAWHRRERADSRPTPCSCARRAASSIA